LRRSNSERISFRALVPQFPVFLQRPVDDVPLQSLAISGYVFREKLEGHEAVEPGVLGLVDNTHPATAELLDDAVVRDGLVDQ
jgi:hypothetical protein